MSDPSPSDPAGRPEAIAPAADGGWKAVFLRAVNGFIDDGCTSLGASISYYTLFSIAPLLLIVVAVAGQWFGADAARGEILSHIAALVGDDVATAIEGMVARAASPGTGLMASAAGVVIALVGATTVFAELQSALDRIWRAPAANRPSGWWALLRARLLSFGLILGLGFLLIVSLVVSAGLSALQRHWAPWLADTWMVARALDLGVNAVLLTALFTMIYKWMPSTRIAWSDVFVGAVGTTVLFMTGRTLIGLYLGGAGATSVFGAAGSIVALLVWVYYSTLIFLFGAELTWAYSHLVGSKRRRRRAERRQRRAKASAPDTLRAASATRSE